MQNREAKSEQVKNLFGNIRSLWAPGNIFKKNYLLHG